MVATLLMFALTAVATVTDVVWRKIYNHTTYTGMVAALALAGARSAAETGLGSESAWCSWWAEIRFDESLVGWLACGGLMLFCFVLFGIGGGDVKLVAMLGAFLGIYRGLETLLWTFVLAGVLAVVLLIWEFGVFRLVALVWRQLTVRLRLRNATAADELKTAEREALKRRLFLGPSALAALAIVHFDLLQYLP